MWLPSACAFMVALAYLLIELVVSYVVHSVMRLLRHKYTLPFTQLVIIRSVRLEELGEKTATTLHLEKERKKEIERLRDIIDSCLTLEFRGKY